MHDDPSTSADERRMEQCLALAREAAAHEEVPVGAIVVLAGEVVGVGRNRVEELGDPLAHAEIEALKQAFAATGDKRLPGAELYCTLEPCFMCASAALHARVGRVVFGARDPKFGAVRSLGNLLEDQRLNHQCEVREGVGAEESAALLRSFFRSRRG